MGSLQRRAKTGSEIQFLRGRPSLVDPAGAGMVRLGNRNATRRMDYESLSPTGEAGMNAPIVFAHGLILGAFLASFFFIVGRWCAK